MAYVLLLEGGNFVRSILVDLVQKGLEVLDVGEHAALLSLEFADLLLEDSTLVTTQCCLPNLLELSLTVDLGLDAVLL